MRPDISVHIEYLVLDGCRPAESQRIADRLQRELARLLAERGVPPGPQARGTDPVIDPGALDPASVADEIGRHSAAAVYRCWTTPLASKEHT